MKTIRNFNDVILAHAAKAVLDSENIMSKVLGDNLLLTGGLKFGMNYIQLVIINDDQLNMANIVLINNGFK